MPKHFPTLFNSYNNQRFSIKANQFDAKESLNFINSHLLSIQKKIMNLFLEVP